MLAVPLIGEDTFHCRHAPSGPNPCRRHHIHGVEARRPDLAHQARHLTGQLGVRGHLGPRHAGGHPDAAHRQRQRHLVGAVPAVPRAAVPPAELLELLGPAHLCF